MRFKQRTLTLLLRLVSLELYCAPILAHIVVVGVAVRHLTTAATDLLKLSDLLLRPLVTLRVYWNQTRYLR